MVAAWGVAIAFVVAQLILAWQQKPFTVTKRLSARSIAFQLFAMSAQSKARGNVLINPGPSRCTGQTWSGNRSRLPWRDVLRRPGHARRRHGADHVRALQGPGPCTSRPR